jgi:ABC-type multidrug transport system ATPase subunit
LLTITGLSKTYGSGVRALDRVDLSIRRGLFGLLGPNGAGKSTLMRTVAALQEPDEGRIVLDGLDVLAEPHELRRRLGYLPQDFGVYPGVSALLLLDHIAVLKGIGDKRARREQVHALLELTNLHDARHKAVSTFSGGMRQRFGIAQALIGNPGLIIVDEPTAGLDPEERNRFLNLLAEIGENVVVILSTHIVDDVSDLCPLMAVIADGRIRLEGAPTELIAKTRGRIWKKKIDRGELEAFRENYQIISTRLFAGRTVVHVLSDTDPGDGFTPEEGGLEDVYFTTLAQTRRAA